MLKFLLILFVLWFIFTRLLRFKFMVYKNTFSNQAANHKKPFRPEGTITVEKPSGKDSRKKDMRDGEYIDYEEV